MRQATVADSPAPTAAQESPIGRAVLQVLCHGQPSFSSVPANPGFNGVSGLMSQLNYIAQGVLEQLVQGKGLRSADSIHRTARLQGYGGGTLGEHFELPACASEPDGSEAGATAAAAALLLKSPRYLVASHVLHQLYRPRESLLPRDPILSRYDLAMHVRRGEKAQADIRPGETRLRNQSEDALVDSALRLLPSASVRRGDGATRLLLGSDDASFAQSLTRRLQRSDHIEVLRLESDTRDASRRDSGANVATWFGSASLRTPLELAAHFAASDRVMLSSMSNMGVFMLTWWAAANNDTFPVLLDLEGRVTTPKLQKGFYFCSMPWGAKHGLCKGSQTACSLSWNARRQFCLNATMRARRSGTEFRDPLRSSATEVLHRDQSDVDPQSAPGQQHTTPPPRASPCACASRQPQPRSGAPSTSETTPFDASWAYKYPSHNFSHHWADRAACARQGAMALARATGLSFGLLGVTGTNEHKSKLEAAHALLCTGTCIECNAATAVIQQFGAVSMPSTADGWLRQLFSDGVARIDASWGFGDILRRGDLAGLLRRRLDALGGDNIFNMKAEEGEQAPMRHIAAAVLARLQPMASSYLGAEAAYGGCKLLLLPGRNLTIKEYISGLWHHDRCGRRLKCFVYLGPVGHDSHPPLVVPRTHRTIYYTYSNGHSSRFDDAHVAKSYAPPISLHGDIGDGFCFDTNGIHRGTLPGTEARHVAIFEFHDDALERAFKEAKVMGAPFGK